MSSKTKPLAVVIGFMGSKPRHIQKYAELYERAGYQTLSRTPTPAMMTSSYTKMPYHGFMRVPEKWPEKDENNPETMQDVAWDILSTTAREHKEQPWILFHILSSNGGTCWEHMRKILSEAEERSNTPQLKELTSTTDYYQPIISDLADIQNRIAGVAFDSGPDSGLENFRNPLETCSPEEIEEAMRENGAQDTSFLSLPHVRKQMRERNDAFIRNLVNDPWRIPQQYLYSKVDPYARWEAVDELVELRRQQYENPSLVKSKRWDDSAHISHLLKHPEEYEKEIQMFIELCEESFATRC